MSIKLTIRPWSDMVATNAFSLPTSADMLAERIRSNLNYWLANYALVMGFFVLVSGFDQLLFFLSFMMPRIGWVAKKIIHQSIISLPFSYFYNGLLVAGLLGVGGVAATIFTKDMRLEVGGVAINELHKYTVTGLGTRPHARTRIDGIEFLTSSYSMPLHPLLVRDLPAASRHSGHRWHRCPFPSLCPAMALPELPSLLTGSLTWGVATGGSGAGARRGQVQGRSQGEGQVWHRQPHEGHQRRVQEQVSGEEGKSTPLMVIDERTRPLWTHQPCERTERAREVEWMMEVEAGSPLLLCRAAINQQAP